MTINRNVLRNSAPPVKVSHKIYKNITKKFPVIPPPLCFPGRSDFLFPPYLIISVKRGGVWSQLD
jgi:hypothetical protein